MYFTGAGKGGREYPLIQPCKVQGMLYGFLFLAYFPILPVISVSGLCKLTVVASLRDILNKIK